MGLKPNRTRRTWLASCASTVAGVSVLAGCTSDSSETNEDEPENDDALSADTWPMYGVDPQNTGYHPTATGPTNEDVTAKLLFESNGTVSDSPAVIGDTLYTAADNQLYAINTETGENEWRSDFPDIRGTYPAISDNRIYVGMNEGIATVNRNNGNLIWQNSVGISNVCPVVDSGAVIGSENLLLYKFDTNNGEETIIHSFRDENIGRPYTSIPAYDDGSVYFAGEHVLHSVNAKNSSVEWTFENPEGKSMGECNPATDGENIYISGADKRLYAIDTKDGTQKWSIKTKSETPQNPSLANGILYVVASDSVLSGGGSWLLAIDTKKEEVIWEDSLQSNINYKPVISNSSVYYANSRQVLAYDRETGDRRWKIDEFNEPIAGPPTISDDHAFISLKSGEIYLIT